MGQGAEDRHAMIWHHEQVLAYQLAKMLIHKPKVSVWIVLLPLLFIFFMQDMKKYKNGIRDFTNGFLKNKKAALDLALNAMQEGLALDDAVERFATDAPPPATGTETLRQRQLREIHFLTGHYHSLLAAHGATYDSLLRDTYQTVGRYQKFLDHLSRLENEVVDSAMTINPPDDEARDLVVAMRTTVERLRRDERDRIFRHPTQPILK